MTRVRNTSLLLALVLALMLAAALFSQYNGSFDWDYATAESQNMDVLGLDKLQGILKDRRTNALVVIRNDKIVHEWYSLSYSSESRHGTASLAKALVAGISLLVANCDGIIGLEDPVWRYIPEWKDDRLKSQITIRQLATHSSGLPHPRKRSNGERTLDAWEEAFWSRRPDPISLTIQNAPILFPPGSQYAYSGPAFDLLGYALTVSLSESPYKDIYKLLKTRIMEPLDIPKLDWSIGYGEEYEVNGMKLYATRGGGMYTARAVARVGQLMLHRGVWQDQRLVDSACVDVVISSVGTPLPQEWVNTHHAAPALGWWSNSNGAWTSVPRDAFAGLGAGHQVLLVVPSLNLVVVRFGQKLGRNSWGGDYWHALEKFLLNPVIRACKAIPNV